MTARILLLDTAAPTHNSYIPIAIVDAFRRHPDVEFVCQAGYGDAIETFRREHCDTFVALGGAGGDLAVIARLCALARRSALWTTEDPYELDENVRVSAPFDAVFTNDLASLPLYGENAHHLPLAASPLFHDLAPVEAESEFLYDVCFVGTAWPNRVRTINRILENARRPLRMKVALPTNEHLPAFELSDTSLLTDWRVPNPELARIANRSRITLSLEREFSGSRSDQASGSTPPPRLFETALAGAFQISLSRGHEAARYFDGESEVAFCDSEEELLDRIDWALDHSQERIAMAEAARARAKRHHLYDHRVATLLDLLGPDTRPIPAAPTGRPKILLVTHNVAGDRPGGGVEIYQQELVAHARDARFYTLYPRVEGGSGSYVLIDHETGERQRYGVPHPAAEDALHDAAHERVFERILVENGIDLVHFQHAIGMPLSLPLIASACGVPTAFTLHDFYLVCSRFNLVNHLGRFCDIARRSPTECGICLSSEGLSSGAQQRRRNFVGHVLSGVTRLIANTPYTADYVRSIYPGLGPEKIDVIEMLTPVAGPSSLRQLNTSVGGRNPTLRVAIPGNFTRLKGADAAIRVMAELRDDPVDFFVLGTFQEPDLEAHMRALALPRVSLRLGYTPQELPQLLSGMDVSLHLSTWPETFMISLGEAWLAGVVPIVTDLGAPGERVLDGINGFKVGVDDVGLVCDLLREMVRDRDRLRALQANARATRVVSSAEHTRELGRLYADLIAAQPLPPLGVALNPERDYTLSTARCGIRTNNASWRSDQATWDGSPWRRVTEPLGTAEIWRNYPTRFRHLALTIAAPDDPGVAVSNLESVDVDGRRRAVSGTVSVRHNLRLRGWAVCRHKGRPLDSILCLQGGGQELYVVRPPDARDDVGAIFPDAVAAGWDFRIDASGLRAGEYRVSLHVVYDGSIVDFGTLLTLSVGDAGASPTRSNARTATDFDPGRFAAGTTLESGAAVAVCTRVAGDRPGGLLRFSGWAADLDGRRVLPNVHLGFEDPKGAITWVWAARTRAQPTSELQDAIFAFAGFEAEIDPETLGVGLRGVLVAESNRTDLLLHRIGAAVLIEPSRILLAGNATPEPGTEVAAAEADTRPAPPYRMSLDRIETDTGREPSLAAVAAIGHLYVRGWIYVPELGPPRTLTLHLAGVDAGIAVALMPVERLDVAEHLGIGEAAQAGFEALVPLSGLTPGRYEFQVSYAGDAAPIRLPMNMSVDKLA